MNEEKVNLFIVGAMKAGTTSFVELLSKHPQIYASPVKEPHFFIKKLPKQLYDPGRFFSLANYMEKEFPKELHITKIETITQYQKIFSLANYQKYLTDSSTSYLHAKESAALIYNYNPNAKIIVILRDPLARAFSHYKMDLGKGRVIKSFEACMIKNISEYNKNNIVWHSYLGMSLYRESIERFRKLFSNVLVIQFENLINNPELEFTNISSFLRVDSFKNIKVEHKNIARTPKFPKLFYFFKRSGLKDYFSKLFISTFKQWIAGKTSSKDKLEMKISKKTSKELNQIFSKEFQV